MEDIQRKLEFDNPSIKIQAISRLVQLIEKWRTDKDAEAINNSTIKIPELSKLWELTDDECPTVSNSACEALVCLVLNGHAELGFILNGILDRCPSAKNLNGFVTSLRDLLLIQGKLEPNVPVINSSRIMRHPFVIVLKQSSRMWPYLLEQTKYLLQISENSYQTVELLTPFLRYVLWDPNRPAELSSMRISLHHVLAEICESTLNDVLLEFLFESIHWLRLDSAHNVQEASVVLQHLVRVVTSRSECRLDQLAASLATVALQMLKQNLDPSSCLQTLVDVLQKRKQESCTIVIEATSLLVAIAFDIATTVHHGILTKLAEILVMNELISPLIAAAFLLPLLRIVATPLLRVTITDGKQSPQERAANLIRFIERNIEYDVDNINESQWTHIDYPLAWESLDCTLAYALFYANLAQKLQLCPSAAHYWLDEVHTDLDYIGHTWHFLSHILIGIVVHGLQDRQLIKKAIAVMVVLANADKTQAPDLFPILLHKLGTETDIDLRLHILHCLPDMATHKITVGPVLQTLRMLSSTPSLQSLSIRLTARLWKHQDRVFPFLHHLLLEDIDSTKVLDYGYDIVIAKAASIRDVCEIRPSQYGAEVLPSLSSTLSKNLNEAGIVPSVLALDGIILLCKAEVIDLRTTWKVLAPKLSKDSRPQVVKKLCELLSLLPQLEVKNAEYETFKLEAVVYLWKMVCANKDRIIVGAAYRALGYFNPELYKLKSLPSQARANLTLPRNMVATPYEQAKNPEDVLTYIPGSCFTKILESLHPDILSDYGSFLETQIKDEVKNLPRGVYHSAWRSCLVTTSSKVLSSIPPLLLDKHDKNKAAGLHASLAGGLLLTFEPPIEYGKHSLPSRRSYIAQAKAYEQNLEVLLKEVPIEVTDWQKTITLSQQWAVYMEKMFFISVEGRKSELEMQKNKGSLKSPDQFELFVNHAWLWTREQLANIIKVAAMKGKPAAQGNAILALGGLAAATAKFTRLMDDEALKKHVAEMPEYMNHNQWISMAYETILSTMIPGRDYKWRIFPWFQSEKSTVQLAMLVRACAAMSISQLALLSDIERVRTVIESLQTVLRNSDSPAIQLYAGLGMGFYLSHLYEEHFTEIGDQEAASLLNMAARDLLDWAMTDDVDSKIGSVLGLTAATCAMCSNSNPDTRLNAADVQSIILDKVDSESEGSIVHEVLCMSLVCITAAACTTNILPMKCAESVLLKMEGFLKKSPNNYGIAAALGQLVHWLQRVAFPSSTEMKDHLLKVWLPSLASENAPTLTRLAAVHGLCALFGLHNSLMQLAENILEPTSDVGLRELVNIMSQIVDGSKDMGMQNCCSWMIGQLYLVMSNQGGRQNLPTNYSYLGPASILGAVVDYVIEALKSVGNLEDEESVDVLGICLNALAQKFSRPLPPLNWTALLTAVIQFAESVELKCLAVHVAINQSSSSSALAVISSCMSSHLFCSLPVDLQIIILESLPQLIKTVPVAKLRMFLEEEFCILLQNYPDSEMAVAALKGLRDALLASDPPQGVTSLLFVITESCYQYVEKHDVLFTIYCECLTSLPDDTLDRLTAVEGTNGCSIERCAKVRTHLITHEKQPLNWINQLIDAAAVSECNRQKVFLYLLPCLQAVGDLDTNACTTWLLEMMGQTKNVLEWKSKLDLKDTDHMCHVVNFYLHVFTVAILSWASRSLCCNIWLRREGDEVLKLLPLGLQVVCSLDGFKDITSKILDWLLFLSEKAAVDDVKKAQIKGALCGLRHSVDFCKTSVWTKAICLH